MIRAPTDPIGRSGVIDEAGPALARETVPGLVGDGLERADNGRSYRDDAMAGASGRVDALRGVARHAVELLVRRFVTLEAGDAGVQQERRDLDRRDDTSRVTSSGVNGRPADGISALPGSVANTV